MLSAAIMSHPSRTWDPRLISRLGSIPVRIVHGEGRTLWESAQAAWLAGDGAYHIVFHDDVLPCEGFPELAEAFLTKHPQTPVAFLTPLDTQASRGGAIASDTFTMGGALCLPSAFIAPFLGWCSRNIKPDWNMDDTRLLLWCCATGRRVLSPVPNLVQHIAEASVARPAQINARSFTFEDKPGAVEWTGETVIVPGDPRAFTISRKMHYV